MPPTPHASAPVHLAVIAASMMLAACQGEAEDGGAQEPGLDDARLPHDRLGRIHVLLRAEQDGPDPELELNGRFVEYRGVDQEFVRARANMPRLAQDILTTGQCAPTQALVSYNSPDDGDDLTLRELSFLDVGDLRLSIGGRDMVLALALVPDILSYVSGVEYVHAEDALPPLAVQPNIKTPVTVFLDGDTAAHLDAPRRLQISSAHGDEDALDLTWSLPDSSAQSLTFRIQGLDNDMRLGDEITCVLADSGEASLDRGELVALGLHPGAKRVRLTAARIEHGGMDIYGFGEAEVLIEVQDQTTIDLPIPR